MVPVDLIRVDLDRLYLPFVHRLLDVLAACRARGADYYVISGYRSLEEQDLLYAQGRTMAGHVVTHARGGSSPHNYGLAADLTRDGRLDRKGLQPDWDAESYAILGEEAERVGLVWGGRWVRPDRPHVQWPGYVTSEQLHTLRRAHALGGLAAAWAAIPTE